MKVFENLTNPADLSSYTNVTAGSGKIGKGTHEVKIKEVELLEASNGNPYLKIVYVDQYLNTRLENIFFTRKDFETGEILESYAYVSLRNAIVNDPKLRQDFFVGLVREDATVLKGLVGLDLVIVVDLPKRGYMPYPTNEEGTEFMIWDVELKAQYGTEVFTSIKDAYDFIQTNDLKKAMNDVRKRANIGTDSNDIAIQAIVQNGGITTKGGTVSGSRNLRPAGASL